MNFHFVMIKVTRYDDEGYPVRWWRSVMPSNTLAVVNGIAKDCADRKVLGKDVQIQLHTIDEVNEYVDYNKVISMIKNDGGHGLVALVGVQTNMMPRALDVANHFLVNDVQVSIGGFHISGLLSVMKTTTQELQDIMDSGITLFAGEVEGRLDQVLQDAFAKELKPLYNYLDDLPGIDNQPIPFLEKSVVQRTIGKFGTFDVGRGCPFDCSFCCIINVQGQKSRFRNIEDVTKVLRYYYEMGTKRFLITDDNFARNKNWEAVLDQIIALRDEGIKINIMIQTDTLSHKIPSFIEKCHAAGVDQVFIGLENINPANLVSINKRQNKINDYKEMVLAWKRFPIVMTASYILGLPSDTYTSIIKDIETIKRELAIDLMFFTIWTSLPGSEDHKMFLDKGLWMDEDYNKYDLNHRVIHHPNMSDEELEAAYNDAWKTFYTFEHMKTIIRRRAALNNHKKLTTAVMLMGYREYQRLFNLSVYDAGFLKIKRRKERRSSFPHESAIVFYPKYIGEIIGTTVSMMSTFFRLLRMTRKIWKDPQRTNYTDQAISKSVATLHVK